jgi:hypothetical protein
MKRPTSRSSKKTSTSVLRVKGGALITVLILAAAILLLVGSYLSTLVSQQRLVNRAILHGEARNAAEGVTAIAMGEIERQITSGSGVLNKKADNLLQGFDLSDEDKARLAPDSSNVLADSLAFEIGALSEESSDRIILSGQDPVNRNDPDLGKSVKVRTVNLFTKATAKDAFGTTHAHTSSHIRFTTGAWFDYAVFYNMDLEFHAGARMTVGPTHANGDIYLTGWAENTTTTDTALNFSDRVTATGHIYRFLKYSSTGPTSTSRGMRGTTGVGGTEQQTRVFGAKFESDGTITSGTDDDLEIMNKAFIATHAYTNDSTMTADDKGVAKTFSQYERWGGGFMDGSWGITPVNPPAMPLYVPETYNGSGVAQGTLRNNAYLMVEPQLSKVNATTDPYTGENLSGHKGDDLENLKFSAKSDLVIKVIPPANPGEQPQWRLEWYHRTDPAYRLSAANPPVRDDTTGLPKLQGSINPFTALDDEDRDNNGAYPLIAPGGAQRDPDIKRALRLALLKAIIAVPYRDDGAGNYGTGANTQTIQRFPVGEAARVTNTNISVSASTSQWPNRPENVLDDDTGTRWSAEGVGQYITFVFSEPQTIDAMEIAWHNGHLRTSNFAIESQQTAGGPFVQIHAGVSSGATSALERVTFPQTTARAIRIIGNGNSVNNWNSITEVAFLGNGSMARNGGAIHVHNPHDDTYNDLNQFNEYLRSSATSWEDRHYFPIYDRREGAPHQTTAGHNAATTGLLGAFHTIIIDMARLHMLLNSPGLWRKPPPAGSAPGTPDGPMIYDPATRFNGVIYLQIPLLPHDHAEVTARFALPDSDKIRPGVRPTASEPGYAVLIRNAGGSTSATGGSGLLPHGAWNIAGEVDGFTFATNAPVYIWGHFNADGNDGTSGTGATTGKDANWTTRHTVPSFYGAHNATLSGSFLQGKELPALIVADAVTQLAATPENSTRDFERMTQQIMADGSDRERAWNDNNGSAASVRTEVAGAIVAGLIPTRFGTQNGDNIWAGGAHNFVRFLQNWQPANPKTTWDYRGSLVALFESEVAKAPYREGSGTSGNDIFKYWFNGPDLNVGFHPDFKLGIYPPGTPPVHTMRLLNIRDISAEDYEKEPAQPDPYN